MTTSLKCSGILHPYLKLEDENTYYIGLLFGLNAMSYAKCLAQCLANVKQLIQFHFVANVYKVIGEENFSSTRVGSSGCSESYTHTRQIHRRHTNFIAYLQGLS